MNRWGHLAPVQDKSLERIISFLLELGQGGPQFLFGFLELFDGLFMENFLGFDLFQEFSFLREKCIKFLLLFNGIEDSRKIFSENMNASEGS